MEDTLDLIVEAIRKLLDLTDRLVGIELTPGQADVFCWLWDASGVYTSRSCYTMLFDGSTGMARALQIWRSRARPNARHPCGVTCLFCDQHDETIDHFPVSCVVSGEVWADCCRSWRFIDWMPAQDHTLED